MPRNLPGKPDLIFPSRKKVVFVHGCFWHRHNCKRGRKVPKSNTDYWIDKFDKNVKRFIEQKQELKKEGWKVLTVWECQLTQKKFDTTMNCVTKFLE